MTAPCAAIPDDPADGATVSGSEMERRTGLSRERLRTWERRHGFPMPVRTASNQRRYRAADVRTVVMVARAVERGVPVPAAITAALQEQASAAVAGPPVRVDAALQQCGQPAMIVTDPERLVISWLNDASLAAPESPAIATGLLLAVPEFGSSAIDALRALMLHPAEAQRVIEHRDWTSRFPQVRRSLAWRLPASAAKEPGVVLLQLPDAAADSDSAPGATGWSDAISAARAVLTRMNGIAATQQALGALRAGTSAIDACLATVQGSRLRMATSVTGASQAHAIELERGGPLGTALAAGEVGWLDGAATHLLGAPANARALLIPLEAGGDRIGAAFVFFQNEVPLRACDEELLGWLGVAIATSLQREHFAAGAAHGS